MAENNEKCIVCGDTYKARLSSYEGEHKGSILCNKHSLQIKRNGQIVDATRSRRRDERICDICGDKNNIRQIGVDGDYKGSLLCEKHYNQVFVHGKITDETIAQKYKERICSFCGSIEEVLYYAKDRMMLCRRHYNQMYLYGKLFERTIFDKNEIVKKENCAEVILYDSEHREKSRAIIDIGDIGLIENHKWRLNTWGYAETKINGSLVFMQNLIYGTINDGEIVDHIDRNRLNNIRANFRIADKSKNAMNSKLASTNKSGVKGVFYSKRHSMWRVYINYEGKRFELGWFKDFEEAVKVRLEAEIKHHGEFSSQKHLFEEYGVSDAQ